MVDWPAGEVGRTLITAAELRERVATLAEAIAADLAGHDPLVLGVLNGAFIFTADLVRALRFPLEVAFVGAASYGQNQWSSGQVEITGIAGERISGRHVLVVEDIVDTGHTLSRLLQMLRSQSPASLRVCALLDKREARRVPVQIDYVGFEVPDQFVVGYGLDAAERFRNLACVALSLEQE